jgi:hypothetical protein
MNFKGFQTLRAKNIVNSIKFYLNMIFTKVNLVGHTSLHLQHYSCYSNTRGVTALPHNRNLILRFGRSSGSNRNNDQSHTSSLWQDEIWMVRMKEVIAFPSCFFFRVIAPLYHEELDCFTPRDTIFLIQDLDWVCGVR